MREKILVVDDDERLLQAFARNLRLEGYTVLVASGGQEALQIYDRDQPDIMLVDIRMPDLDGLTVLQRIRERDTEADVIITTGHGDKEDVIAALRAGASDFIPKPIDQLALQSALRRAEDRLQLKRELHETQEALRESEERFRVAVQNSPIVVAHTDSDLRFTWIYTARVGVEAGEIVGRRDDDLLPLEEAAEMRNLKRQVLETGVGVRREVELSSPNGDFVFDMTVEPLRSPAGEVVGVTIAAMDITERKQAENELQESHQRETVFNALLRISMQDLSLEEQLGRTLDEILSIPWLPVLRQGAIFMVGDEPGVLELRVQRGLSPAWRVTCARISFGQCLCGRAAALGEIQFATRVDERHETRYQDMAPHGHYCVPILSTGKVLGVFSLYLEEGHLEQPQEKEFLRAVAHILAGMMERKQSEEALRKSEARFRALFERAGFGIASCDLDGRLLEVNPAFEELLGYTRDQLKQMTFVDFTYPDDAQKDVDLFESMIAGELDRYGMRKRYVCRDGEVIWGDLTVSLVRDDEGHPLFAFGMVQGVTEQVQKDC
jgi:PAS domain S-box-containing protein